MAVATLRPPSSRAIAFTAVVPMSRPRTRALTPRQCPPAAGAPSSRRLAPLPLLAAAHRGSSLRARLGARRPLLLHSLRSRLLTGRPIRVHTLGSALASLHWCVSIAPAAALPGQVPAPRYVLAAAPPGQVPVPGYVPAAAPPGPAAPSGPGAAHARRRARRVARAAAPAERPAPGPAAGEAWSPAARKAPAHARVGRRLRNRSLDIGCRRRGCGRRGWRLGVTGARGAGRRAGPAAAGRIRRPRRRVTGGVGAAGGAGVVVAPGAGTVVAPRGAGGLGGVPSTGRRSGRRAVGIAAAFTAGRIGGGIALGARRRVRRHHARLCRRSGGAGLRHGRGGARLARGGAAIAASLGGGRLRRRGDDARRGRRRRRRGGRRQALRLERGPNIARRARGDDRARLHRGRRARPVPLAGARLAATGRTSTSRTGRSSPPAYCSRAAPGPGRVRSDGGDAHHCVVDGDVPVHIDVGHVHVGVAGPRRC